MVSINRVTKVVKGGKNLSFSALVVVGDPRREGGRLRRRQGQGSARGDQKGIEAAKKNLRKVNVLETTIPHQVLGEFGSGQVLLKPAPEGTGVIAGGPVRAVIQAVRDSQRADQVDRLAQSAQRGEGDHRRARAVARQERRGRDARSGDGEAVKRIMAYAKATIKIKLIAARSARRRSTR